MKKISIITVCYNSQDTLEDTIQSVLNQDYQNIEYIIVDGKSTDNTLKIIEKYQDKITKVISEPDKGLYDAINKGIKNASGEIVGIINSDDVLAYKSAVSDIAQTFEQQNCDAVYADLVYVKQNNLNSITRKWISGNYKHGKFLWGWMPPHPTFYAKKSLFEQYGYYSLQLKSAADYELMLRFIHKHKISLGYLPKTLVKMRVGGMSNASLKNRLAANQEDQMAWEMNNLTPYLFTPYLKPLRKVFQFLNK
ncbi:MAG TPA: glycosyl transferase [Flavobacteriales bacterium]|nr:glycosyl transferase [Flavobacteriales bacterium]|tara:strand:- start:57783 stop:58535 length:753 start_codon:yes stop_codon:yes gene_type:complete